MNIEHEITTFSVACSLNFIMKSMQLTTFLKQTNSAGSALCVTLAYVCVTRALWCDPAKPGRSRKIFWLSFKNGKNARNSKNFTLKITFFWKFEVQISEKRKKERKNERKRKKGKTERKKKKGKKSSLSHVDQIVWLHSEPSEREARTTCERPVQKKFVTLPKTQRPTLQK